MRAERGLDLSECGRKGEKQHILAYVLSEEERAGFAESGWM